MKWSLETVCNRGVTWVGQILKKWSFIWYDYLGPASNKGPLPCAASYSGESRNCKGRTWCLQKFDFYSRIGLWSEAIDDLASWSRQAKPNQKCFQAQLFWHALHLAQVARRRVWDTAAARNKESQSWLSKRFLERRFFSFSPGRRWRRPQSSTPLGGGTASLPRLNLSEERPILLPIVWCWWGIWGSWGRIWKGYQLPKVWPRYTKRQEELCVYLCDWNLPLKQIISIVVSFFLFY